MLPEVPIFIERFNSNNQLFLVTVTVTKRGLFNSTTGTNPSKVGDLSPPPPCASKDLDNLEFTVDWEAEASDGWLDGASSARS